MIHSLLGDSYGCVNHACGAINPPSRVEYKPVSPPLVLKKLRIREEIYLSDLPTLRSEDEESVVYHVHVPIKIWFVANIKHNREQRCIPGGVKLPD